MPATDLADLSSENGDGIHPDDATWILTSAFIIFTMQSGFGLLEAGLVSRKNETNIMVKNAVDVIYGGLGYWIFGFGISFGQDSLSNAFSGWGYFFFDSDDNNMGLFAKYFFQLSFATTATTIVSGAMAERVDIKAYVAFSFLNTISYCYPAHWVWDSNGFLAQMGAVDVAGCGPVHLVGGVAGVVAAIMLKPRKNKFDENGKPRELQMASPTNVLLGTFMLWWGWLGFNCGSTFGTSGIKWKIAARSAVVTINGSVGGGIYGMLYSYVFYKKKLLINVFVVGILGGLVSVTAICAVCRPWEALIIGTIGGVVATLGQFWEEKLQIDDPVGAFPTHALASIWGLVATALFCEPTPKFTEFRGLFKGGPWKFLGVQLLVVVCCIAWAAITTFILLYLIDKTIGIRMSDEEEEMGADLYVHNIKSLPDAPFGRNNHEMCARCGQCNVDGEENNNRSETLPLGRHSADTPQSSPSERGSTSNIDSNKFQEISATALHEMQPKIMKNIVDVVHDKLELALPSVDEPCVIRGRGNHGFLDN